MTGARPSESRNSLSTYRNTASTSAAARVAVACTINNRRIKYLQLKITSTSPDRATIDRRRLLNLMQSCANQSSHSLLTAQRCMSSAQIPSCLHRPSTDRAARSIDGGANERSSNSGERSTNSAYSSDPCDSFISNIGA